MAEHTFGFRTRALHAGGTPDAEHGARAVPIYQTSSFVFKDADDAANLFSLQKYGNIYSRLSNPTVAALEERIASLEGGIGAVATASGMAAEFITFAALCQQGDHIVASPSCTAAPSPSWTCPCAASALRPPSCPAPTPPTTRRH